MQPCRTGSDFRAGLLLDSGGEVQDLESRQELRERLARAGGVTPD